ncbi:neprilysin-like 14 [Haematobia irritans]|uniref:neprilysin-like 14 n=1 Tax=Haematobia irritans TaxID=7368 RepID=UPI003F5086A3
MLKAFLYKISGQIANIIMLWLLTFGEFNGSMKVYGETTIFPIYKQEESLRAAKSKEVQTYMNLSVNPCEDFYEYACGNWHRYHSPPSMAEPETVETLDTILDNKVDKDLLILLEENNTIEDIAAVRKMKTFYKSCLDARQGDIPHQLFISDFIKSNGGFPAVPGSNWMALHHNYDWQHVIAILRHNYGLNILVGMEVNNNFQSMEENSLYLKEPSTITPRSLCNAKVAQSIDVTDHQYDALEREVAHNLRSWLSMNKEESYRVAADIVTFENDLCRAMYVNGTEFQDEEEEDFIGSSTRESDSSMRYVRKNLNSFSRDFNNSLDFNTIVANSFGVAVAKPVFMTSPKYFENLVQVINDYEEYNKTIVANYIMYMTLSHFNFPPNDTASNRPFYCLGVVKKYFPKILGYMYYNKYAITMDQHSVAKMFENLKKIFDASFNNYWMDESTRRLGKKRLNDMTLQFPMYDRLNLNMEFGRNDFWKNLCKIMAEVRVNDVNRLLSPDEPKPMDEVEAYETRMVYRSYHNHIDIGWGLLQSPYYHHALPLAMRYAMIGQKLAKTMASAFDDKGWSANTMDHKIWESQTAVEYYKRANCFTTQIGNYLHNDPHSFHNVSQSRQLIAQSVGLSQAFNAYLDWLFYKNPSNDQDELLKETLPEFDFTNTQLFFITFAQAHCEAHKKTKKVDSKSNSTMLWRKHSLRRYVVNGPLTNFIEFGREFHCPIGSQMNEADKCIIY